VRLPRTLQVLACIALLLLACPTASADVAWDHTLTDDASDVVDVLEPANPVPDREEVDILSANAAGEGDDLNVTLVLAGAYSPQATYQVTVNADGDDSKDYFFSYASGHFTIDGYDLTEPQPVHHISADGTHLSWLVAKARVSVAAGLEVTHAEAHLFAGLTNYVDTVGEAGGSGGNGGGDGEPTNLRAELEFVEVNRVVYSFEIAVTGDDAKDLRGEFDADVDGTVSKAEYDQHMGFLQLNFASWNTSDLELDGDGPISKGMTLELEGVIGSAGSTAPVTQVVVLELRFAEPRESSSHTYEGILSSTEAAGEMWDVTAESLWVMTAPPGWRFGTDGWPSDLRTYLGSGGTTVTLSGLQMQSGWNASMGAIGSLTITEKGGGGEEEEEAPGPGPVAAVSAMLVATSITVRRRRH